MRIKFSSGTKCLSADCCFSVLALYNPQERWSSTKWTPSSSYHQNVARLTLNNHHSLLKFTVLKLWKESLYILVINSTKSKIRRITSHLNWTHWRQERITTYVVGHLGPDLWQAHRCGGVNSVNPTLLNLSY